MRATVILYLAKVACGPFADSDSVTGQKRGGFSGLLTLRFARFERRKQRQAHGNLT
jgi:hypothetical protein